MEIGATNGAERLGDVGAAGLVEEELIRAGEGEEDAESTGEVEE